MFDACVEKAVNGFANAGVPMEKLILGVPFYSRKWDGVKGAGCRNGLGMEAETAKEKPDPAIPGKADEVPEVVVDLLPEREAEQLADTVMRQEEEERQTEFYRVLGRLLDQMIQKRRQEERSRRVDEAIRRHQQSRREAAATLEQKGKRTKAKRSH